MISVLHGVSLKMQDGTKVDFDLYTVDYDYGKVILGGDFILGNLVEPISAKYRYQDMLDRSAMCKSAVSLHLQNH